MSCVFATKYLLTSSKVEYEWVGGSGEGSAKDNAMHVERSSGGKAGLHDATYYCEQMKQRKFEFVEGSLRK